MKRIWHITLNDYLEIVKRAKAGGLKPGDSMEDYLEEYMEEQGKEPSGHTELTKEELLREWTSKGKKVLDVETDNEGKQSYKINEADDGQET